MKKKKTKPMPEHLLQALLETSKKRIPIEGINSGVAVMYLDPKVIESMAAEILRSRRKFGAS